MRIDRYRQEVEKLASYGTNGFGEVFPTPNPPQREGDSYDFPTNAELLSDAQLDDWLTFLGAWKSYTSYKMGQLETEIFVLSEGYDLMFAVKSAEHEQSSNKRLLKESLKGQILATEPEIAELAQKLVFMNGELRILKGRYSLYDNQFDTISRIVTRRGQERIRP